MGYGRDDEFHNNDGEEVGTKPKALRDISSVLLDSREEHAINAMVVVGSSEA